ncbi:hypothetical protein J8J27_21855, partial [Mycobacterium tuberculosis]|nr:hypothetical protein [Mycobacterium tuberculosis]
AHAYINRHRRFFSETAHVVGTLVSPTTLAALLDRAAGAGAAVLFRSDRDGARGLPPLAELAWNHTTLRALKVDPSLTYLQVLYPSVAAAIDAADRFADTCFAHLEFTRFAGKLTCLGVPLVRLDDADAIEALIVAHEAAGLTVFNPHRYTLEEGGMKQPDP